MASIPLVQVFHVGLVVQEYLQAPAQKGTLRNNTKVKLKSAHIELELLEEELNVCHCLKKHHPIPLPCHPGSHTLLGAPVIQVLPRLYSAKQRL